MAIEPMKWIALQERMNALLVFHMSDKLLDAFGKLRRDVDAAAPAMEAQERDAAIWNHSPCSCGRKWLNTPYCCECGYIWPNENEYVAESKGTSDAEPA